MRKRLIAGKERHLSGWKKEPIDHRDLKLAVPGPILPPKHDVLAIMPPVNDQGGIGSCVANGTCEAFEATEPKDVQPRRLYSRLFVYYNGRVMYENIPPAEDSGMYIRDGVKVVANFGVPLEHTWPYSDDSRFSLKPPVNAYSEASLHKAQMYYRCASSDGRANVMAMKASIAQGFPVVFGFNVPENFESQQCANTGILHYPGSNEGYVGGHCIVAVGYDDNFVIDGVAGAFLCRNSWGEGWGLQGNFYMPYRFITDGIADDPWTIRRAQS